MDKTTKVRPSPAKSATLYKTGTVKKGTDGNKWIIVENKNGVKRWKLVKKTSKKPPKKVSKKNKWSMEMFFEIKKVITENELEKVALLNKDSKKIYKIIKEELIPEFNKLGIKSYIIPVPLSKNDTYWGDYTISFLEEVHNIDVDAYLDSKSFVFNFYLNYEGDEIVLTKPITIEDWTLDINEKNKIIDIFEKHLLGYYDWDGSNNSTMHIHYEKQNIKPIIKSKLKDNDTYPYLQININTKKDLLKEIELRELLLKNLYDDIKKNGYNADWECGYNDFEATIYSFDIDKKKEKAIYKKIESFIEKQSFITSYNLFFTDKSV